VREVVVGGVPLRLHPAGAVWAPAGGRLFVADLHLGKGATLRSAGVPLPGGTTAETMARVDRVIGEVSASAPVREVWVLGDLVHARAGLDRDVVAEVAAWIVGLPGRTLHLVRGNHDRGAGRLPGAWRLEQHAEPCAVGTPDGPLHLAHEPPTEGAGPMGMLAGHLHPMVRAGRGRTRLPKLPAFLGREAKGEGLDLLVLPAFGRLIDGAVVRGSPGWRAWACVEGEVVPLPAGGW